MCIIPQATDECDEFANTVINLIEAHYHPPEEKKGLIGNEKEFHHAINEADKTDYWAILPFKQPASPSPSTNTVATAKEKSFFRHFTAYFGTDRATAPAAIAETEQAPPNQESVVKPKKKRTTDQITKLIVFEALEKTIFISLKSVILNLKVVKKLNEEQQELRATTMEIALDIVEEFESREVKLYLPNVHTPIANQRNLSTIEASELKDKCENTRSIVATFTIKFHNHMERNFGSVILTEPNAAGYLKSATNYVLGGIYHAGKLMHNVRGTSKWRAQSPDQLEMEIIKIENEILESYFETELTVRCESKVRQLYLNGRKLFFDINTHKYAIERIADDLDPADLSALQSLWQQIIGLYSNIPNEYRPKNDDL